MGNVAINGFGRIGRSILRIIVENDSDINVVAINDLGNYENLAYLLKPVSYTHLRAHET